MAEVEKKKLTIQERAKIFRAKKKARLNEKLKKKTPEPAQREPLDPNRKKKKRPPKKVQQVRNVDKPQSEKKAKYFKLVNACFDQFDKMFVVLVDNVQSRQMQQIRQSLRGQATVLMGKNTRLKKVLSMRAENGNDRDELLYEKFVAGNLLKQNVGLVMTNGDLNDIRAKITANKVQAPARQGAVAPLDVIVPAGNTGLEPTKTSFFQALNIGTKITKGTVEILKDEKVITKGEKVGSSEATLLQMLGIKPFFYGLEIIKIYDEGSVYGPAVLDMTDEDMKQKFEEGISRVTGFSLGCGYTTSISFPHVLMSAFKRALSVTVATDYTAAKHKDLKEAILSGKVAAAAPAAPAAAPAGGKGKGKEEKAPAAAPPPKPAPKAPEPEEEEEEMGLGLFD